MIIYQITNKITNDVYVGKTSRNFKKRISAHKSIAKRGKGSFLHKAIRKYGIENFSFQVLEENIVDEITLNKRGDSIELIWNKTDSKWYIIGSNSSINIS